MPGHRGIDGPFSRASVHQRIGREKKEREYGEESMKAIVLSCDKYHPLADLMMHTYQKLWPDNPFVFRVPYNEVYPQWLQDKYKGKIELIKAPFPVKETMKTLLSDIPDDEWLYWCMDDRYLMKIDPKRASDIYKKVLELSDKQIVSVSMARRKQERWYKEGAFIKLPGGFKLLESIYTDSDQLHDMWSHQFARCKPVRRMFESFPDRPFVAKEMDYFPKRKLVGEKRYDAERDIITSGESTSRGELTINCFLALKRWGLKVPAGFNISSWRYQTSEDFRRRGRRDSRLIAGIIRWLKYKYTGLLRRIYGVR